MMSSPDRDQGMGPLPPALSSMWRLCKLGYRHEPRLMVAAFVLSQFAALPDALLALTRLCLLHYAVDEKTTVTKLPQPDARQQEILQALGVSLPSM